MDNSSVNLTLLKGTPLEVPYVLDDAVASVGRLLNRAGIETSISFNRLDPRRVNIIFGLQMPNTAPLNQIREIADPAKTMIFNTEQLGGESHWITEEYLSLLSSYVTLDYNFHNLTVLKETHPNSRCFEFPLIPDDRFGYNVERRSVNFEINYDLVFYGSSSIGNRIGKLQSMASEGVKVKLVGGVFGSNLTPNIIDCKAVINLHGFRSMLFETIRCLRPAALGMPIISEISRHSCVASWEESGIIFLDPDRLTSSVVEHLSNTASLMSAGRKLRAFVEDPKWPQIAASVISHAVRSL